MRSYRFSFEAPDARVLCVSCRDVAPVISRSLRYEFEDLIGALDAVDVIAPGGTPASAEGTSLLRKGVGMLQQLAAQVYRRLVVKADGFPPVDRLRRRRPVVSRDYELVFVCTESASDLYNLGPSAMWTSTARVSICYIQELYAPDVPALGEDILRILRRFDHILVGYRGTCEPLAKATGRPCHHLLPSTDALKFCPYPNTPKRVIDFYAMGRRPSNTHQALLRMAEAGDWYYMYDTVPNCKVDYVEHRNRMADMIKRSRYFLVNAALAGSTGRTGGQEELGFRFIEGAAGGAVLVGHAPRNDWFDDDFGWDDSVIEVPFDSGDIACVIAELDADPRRLERISKTNVVSSLRRNDHVYRWGQILALAGLEETRAMAERRRELELLAGSIVATTPQI